MRKVNLTYLLYSVISGIQIFSEGRVIAYIPPYSSGSHTRYSSCQICVKKREADHDIEYAARNLIVKHWGTLETSRVPLVS